MPEDRRSTGSPREYIWLVLPVVFLVGLAVWAGRFRREDAPPVKVESKIFRLQTPVIERLNPTGYDVSKGGDTKLYLKVSTAGDFSRINFNGWDWLEDIYVVAIKDGKSRRIDELLDGNRRVLLGGDGGGLGYPVPGQQSFYEHYLAFRLQDAPRDAGALELRWDVAYGPNLSAITGETRAEMIKKSRQSGQALYASARVPLRRDGEKIKPAKVSTDPMFDIRQTTVKKTKQAGKTTKIRIVWDIFYRGPIPEKQWDRLLLVGRLHLYDKTGRSYETDGLSGFATPTQGRRHYKIMQEMDVALFNSMFKTEPQWSVQGSFSLNHAWPRRVNVPLDFSDQSVSIKKK